MSDAIVRPFTPGDADACYQVCLRTGDHGADATALHTDPRLIGEIWVGPYLERWPKHAFVLTEESTVKGYIVGAPDTAEHERWLEQEWLPPLRLRYPLDAFPAGTADADCVRLLHNPWKTPEQLASGWPAHLHIDLLPEMQQRGYGRALMNAFLASLREAGVAAVHVGVSSANPGAIAFYRRLGFRDLHGGTVWGRATDPA
ncbi:MAG: GNAT family N-acetyltransferase [Acidimicrobiia bacterium]|nr:GNAT family N-acetyltransferase [Acidimicrobiia bacterium]